VVDKRLMWVPGMILFSIAIFSTLYIHGNPLPARSGNATSTISHPLAAVSSMYRSVEQGDWHRLERKISQQAWDKLNKSGFLKYWQLQLAKDSSIDYVSFVVMRWGEADSDTTWVLGRAVWVSAKDVIPDTTQKVILKKSKNNWLIDDIIFYPVVDQVGQFFAAVSQQNWDAAGDLAGEAAVLSVMSRQQFKGIMRYLPEDFAVVDGEAWVKGQLVTGQPDDAIIQEVNVHLKKHDGREWRITDIVGTAAEK